jgi:hypothetical protein
VAAHTRSKFLNGGPHWRDGVCLRCGKPLAMADAVWLELDQRVDEYHDLGVPNGKSQGSFQFGKGCAVTLRKRAKLALEQYAAKVQP